GGGRGRGELWVGAEGITSPKGRSFDGRLNPPVFHFRRLSCTRPSIGFRKTSHGSHIERGMTLTPENSSWADLGLSPPLIVITRRTISPRLSSPTRASAAETTYDKSGLLATTTFAPGTRTGSNTLPHSKKNRASASRSSVERTVKRGNGERLVPSNDGGMRQIPPFPIRSFSC